MAKILFSGEIKDCRIICNVLKAITFKEFAVLRPLNEGLKITIEDMKCSETSAYIPSSAFEEYYVDNSNDVMFKISLKALTECLNIYGDEGIPYAKLTYKGEGYPLYLITRHSEENITVDCEINTLNVDEFDEVSIGDDSDDNNIILNGELFMDALDELDLTSETFQLQFSPTRPQFRIVTTNLIGESVIDISKDTDAVISFKCEAQSTSKYAFNYIKQILKVMHFASKISISIGQTGLLGIKLFINSDSKQLFVEYFVSALFDDD